MFSFDIESTRAQGQEFIEGLKIFSHLANVSDYRSLVIHPVSTTHFRMHDAASKAQALAQAPSTCPLAWKTQTTW